MRFTISTLTVTTTRFSGVLGAMWAHFSSLRVIVNVHLGTGPGLEVLNIIISLIVAHGHYQARHSQRTWERLQLTGCHQNVLVGEGQVGVGETW